MVKLNSRNPRPWQGNLQFDKRMRNPKIAAHDCVAIGSKVVCGLSRVQSCFYLTPLLTRFGGNGRCATDRIPANPTLKIGSQGSLSMLEAFHQRVSRSCMNDCRADIMYVMLHECRYLQIQQTRVLHFSEVTWSVLIQRRASSEKLRPAILGFGRGPSSRPRPTLEDLSTRLVATRAMLETKLVSLHLEI